MKKSTYDILVGVCVIRTSGNAVTVLAQLENQRILHLATKDRHVRSELGMNK